MLTTPWRSGRTRSDLAIEPGTNRLHVLVVEMAGKVHLDERLIDPRHHGRVQVGRNGFQGLDQAVVGLVVVGHELLRRAAGVPLADPVVDLVDLVLALRLHAPRRRGLGLATAQGQDAIDRPLPPACAWSLP
jgi:hypothetical protein